MKVAQRLGVLGLLLNRRSGLSIRNGVLLYKQLIHPMMDYLCPTHYNIRKLQVLHSKCLCIAINATWYTGNKQIHEDFGIPFFTDHIRSPTERFDSSKLADMGNPLVMQFGS
jgi:hypothetical protein